MRSNATARDKTLPASARAVGRALETPHEVAEGPAARRSPGPVTETGGEPWTTSSTSSEALPARQRASWHTSGPFVLTPPPLSTR